MTAAKFGAVASQTDDVGGTFTIAKPTGTVDGEWMFMGLGCSVSGGQSIAPPAGWTQKYLHASGKFGVWVRKANGEGASYTITQTGGANPRAGCGFIIRVIGGDPDREPIVGIATEAAASASCKAASTLAPSGAALLYHIGYSTSASSANVTSTPPVGMKERRDVEENNTSGTSVHVQLAVSEIAIGPGKTRDRIATLSTAVDNIGIQLIVFQVPLVASVPDGAAREVLVELAHYDEDAASVVFKKYSGRGVTFTGGEHYEPRLLGPVTIGLTAIDSVGVGGVVASAVSQIRLNNRDGALDSIYRRMLSVQRGVVIKTVAVTSETKSDLGAGAVSNAVTVFFGRVSRLIPDGDDMIVMASDITALLDVPLQATEYDGTADFGGGAEKKGLTKPALFGKCYNLLPEQLGTISGRETFQLHSRFTSDVLAVYIRGVAQTEVVGVPGAAQYRQLLSDGSFELGSAPDGDVTCTAAGDAPVSYANQHGEVIQAMVTGFGPQLGTVDINAGSFADADALLPGEIGIYFPAGDRSSARQAVERVLRSGVLWLYCGRDEKLALAMARPAPAERLVLKEPYIVALKPRALPSALEPAPSAIDVFTERNWHPLANIASSVTGSTRRKLAGPGRTVKSVSTALETRQLPKRRWSIDGLWVVDDDGQFLADSLREWIEPGLRVFEVVTDRYIGQVTLGMGVEIESYSKYRLTGGFFGIVAGWREDLARRELTLIVIGSSEGDTVELREDGLLVELREDGRPELRE